MLASHRHACVTEIHHLMYARHNCTRENPRTTRPSHDAWNAGPEPEEPAALHRAIQVTSGASLFQGDGPLFPADLGDGGVPDVGRHGNAPAIVLEYQRADE